MTKKKKAAFGFSQSQITAATKWCNYVKGDGRRPMDESAHTRYQPTVISDGKSELARNKPLVIGRCGGEKAKLFLDSGAEMNVIDWQYLQELKRKQIPVRFLLCRALAYILTDVYGHVFNMLSSVIGYDGLCIITIIVHYIYIHSHTYISLNHILLFVWIQLSRNPALPLQTTALLPVAERYCFSVFTCANY
jgi:hypothetical protein